ncbi:phage baseplate assembly protein V [Leptolyngbya sp. AN02str]|uniref:phage baseplate assembly protein V n=1 Tax=Leptolyngbya sp. AN02str TaxID=3423363 RepID=UPI003D313AFF
MNSIHTLPKLTVEVNNVALSPTDDYRLGSIRIQQRLSLPTLCELTFFDPKGALGADSRLMPGVALGVWMHGRTTPLFEGELTALEYRYEPDHGRQIRLRGYDRMHRLRKSYSVRAHVQVTVADLAEELVAPLGIVVSAAATGPLWHRLIQDRQSDLELLTTMAERSGLYWVLHSNTLHLLTLAGTGAAIPLTLGESLFEAQVEVNSDAIVRSVATAGWNPLRMETHQGTATAAQSGRDVAAHVSPEDVGSTGERTLVNQTVQADQQADAIAQALLDRSQAQEITLQGVAEGNPDLCPGCPITVDNVAPHLTGQYVLTSVNHTMNPVQGYVSEISTLPPTPRLPVSSASTTIGTVTQVNDPDGLGRVQVSLPAYRDVETGWMAILTPGAGAGKGLVSLPDVGDQVLVLCPQGDPAQGVVLGSLYGVQTAPDWGIEAGRIKRHTWLTPGGQRIQFNDVEQQLRLENGDGSFVELAPTGVTVHAQRDLTLEAPGKTVTIRGQHIEFERA